MYLRIHSHPYLQIHLQNAKKKCKDRKSSQNTEGSSIRLFLQMKCLFDGISQIGNGQIPRSI
jgi:hypothetical protein